MAILGFIKTALLVIKMGYEWSSKLSLSQPYNKQIILLSSIFQMMGTPMEALKQEKVTPEDSNHSN